MSIFDGLDAIIDIAVGIDATWVWRRSSLNHSHRRTLQELCGGRGRDFDGQELVHKLLRQVNDNWDRADEALKGVAPNAENWIRRKNLYIDPASTSDEVTLERVITQVTDGNWWNQIPVDHLLLGDDGHKIVDMVHRDGDGGRDFELIELKIGDADTPLSAASQLLKYGIVYAFFRNQYEEYFENPVRTELLNAARLTLNVLAPWDFYQDFAACDWLAEFESKLQDALKHISTTSSLDLPEMDFQFQSFPKSFAWAASMANDEDAQKKVLWAIHHREPVFRP